MLYNLILDTISRFPRDTNFYSTSAKKELALQINNKIVKELQMKLSNQAMGALMMALQKSLLEQTDIVPTLQSFEFTIDSNEELLVRNPPTFKVSEQEILETNQTTGSD